MAIEQPNFVLRGIRRVAEVTLPWAALGVGLGWFVPGLSFLFNPAMGVTFADIAATSLIARSRVPYAAAA